MKPGTVTGFLVDVHVYENQIPDIKTQLSREILEAPAIPNIVNWTSIFDWSARDMVWSESYKCHGPLRNAAVAV